MKSKEEILEAETSHITFISVLVCSMPIPVFAKDSNAWESSLKAMDLWASEVSKEDKARIEELEKQASNLTKKLQDAKTSDGRGWKAVERLQRGNDALRDQLDDLKAKIEALEKELAIRRLLTKSRGLKPSGFCSGHQDELTCSVCYPDLYELILGHCEVSTILRTERDALKSLLRKVMLEAIGPNDYGLSPELLDEIDQLNK